MQSHVKRLAQVGLVLLNGMIADGLFYSAHAQCAPTDKIYIDPRLVPQRHPISPEAARSLMRPNNMNPAISQQLLQEYMQKDQPIVVPFGTGKVLVHPTNPCIQQYIP
jgi:hypothetical protein